MLEGVGKGGDEELSDCWSPGSRPARAFLLLWSHPWPPLRDRYSSCVRSDEGGEACGVKGLNAGLCCLVWTRWPGGGELRWIGEGRGGVAWVMMRTAARLVPGQKDGCAAECPPLSLVRAVLSVLARFEAVRGAPGPGWAGTSL